MELTTFNNITMPGAIVLVALMAMVCFILWILLKDK